MPRMLLTPLAWLSSMIGQTLAANASASLLRASMDACRTAAGRGAPSLLAARFSGGERSLSSATSSSRSLRVRLPDCFGRGNYNCGRLVNSSRIRCRTRWAGPMELTSRRIGTWADMFCRGTCKR
jgi:hypothetical protein